DRLAPEREAWKARNAYYYRERARYFAFYIPPGQAVLEIGNGTGDVLEAVSARRGVGCELSPAMAAAAARAGSRFEFCALDNEEIPLDERFDAIVVSGVIGDLTDVQAFLRALRRLCTRRTRLYVDHYNPLWQPLVTPLAGLLPLDHGGLPVPQRARQHPGVARPHPGDGLLDRSGVRRRRLRGRHPGGDRGRDRRAPRPPRPAGPRGGPARQGRRGP